MHKNESPSVLWAVPQAVGSHIENKKGISILQNISLGDRCTDSSPHPIVLGLVILIKYSKPKVVNLCSYLEACPAVIKKLLEPVVCAVYRMGAGSFGLLWICTGLNQHRV